EARDSSHPRSSDYPLTVFPVCLPLSVALPACHLSGQRSLPQSVCCHLCRQIPPHARSHPVYIHPASWFPPDNISSHRHIYRLCNLRSHKGCSPHDRQHPSLRSPVPSLCCHGVQIPRLLTALRFPYLFY